MLLVNSYCSIAKSCGTLCDPMDCSMPGSYVFTVSQSLLRLLSIEPYLTILSSASLFSFFLQPIPASQSFPMSQFFTSGGQSIGLQLQQQSFQWILGLVSFRIDWFALLAVQGTLKSLLQHHNSKAPILQHSASFMVQRSHPYMTSGKTIAFTVLFAGQVVSLLFNTLSMFVIAFLPRSMCLLISWLQSSNSLWPHGL